MFRLVRKLSSNSSPKERLIKLTDGSRYYRKDMNRAEMIRINWPIVSVSFVSFWLIYQIRKARNNRQSVLPGFSAIKNELSFLQRKKIEYFQAEKSSSLLSVEDWLKEQSLSDYLRAFLLQVEAIQCYNKNDTKKAKQYLTQAVSLCRKLNKTHNDFLVINLTYYLSLIAILEDELEKGIEGLLFCSSQICGLRKSEAWSDLEMFEHYSYSRMALEYIASYVRVTCNMKHMLQKDAPDLKKFATSALEIFEDLTRNFFSSPASFLAIPDEQKSDLLVVQVINDFIYQQLECLSDSEKPDHLMHYIAYTNQRNRGMTSTEMAKELLYTKLNQAFILEKQKKLDDALKALNSIIFSARDTKVVNLAKLRKNVVLDKLKLQNAI